MSLDSQSTAPWLLVPPGNAISVEHPCIVKNVERAIEMLGGPDAIAQTLQHQTERALALSFRPYDPAVRTVISSHRPANNVLLSITAPRRTGRRRKRGSQDAFMEHAPPRKKDVAYMLRSMIDNPDNYQVSPVSSIPSTHVWRDMPDYVYSTTRSHFLQEVKSKVLRQQLPLLKSFDLPRTYGLQDTETLPPPVWSTQTIPQNYAYRTNPLLKTTTDAATGEKTTVRGYNLTPPKIYTAQMQWDTPDYPTSIMQGCPPLESDPNPQMRQIVDFITPLFEERPIWTRRALINAMPATLSVNTLRFALAYVAYAIRSGPWRDTYVRIGVDPRRDPKCRFYQTVMLQLMSKDKRTGAEARTLYTRTWARSYDKESHIFDGTKKVPADGKVWQLCDVTDPQLQPLLNVPDKDIREQCEIRYFGWYQNGTNAKLRIALKAKVDALTAGQTLNQPELDMFLNLAEEIGYLDQAGENGRVAQDSCYLPAGLSRQAYEWAALYRALGKTENTLGGVEQRPHVAKTKPKPAQAVARPRPPKTVDRTPKRNLPARTTSARRPKTNTPRPIRENIEQQPSEAATSASQAVNMTTAHGEEGVEDVPVEDGRRHSEVQATESQCEIQRETRDPSETYASTGGIELDDNGEVILPSIEDYLGNDDDELDLDIKLEDEEDADWAPEGAT